jgi:CHAT domain-containing protein
MDGLAMLYADSKQVEKAINLFEKFIEWEKGNLPTGDERLVNTLLHYGLYLSELKLCDDAESKYLEMVNIVNSKKPIDSLRLREIYHGMALMHFQCSDSETNRKKAIQFALIASDISLSFQGSASTNYLMDLSLLSSLNRGTKDALKYDLQCLEIIDKTYKNNHFLYNGELLSTSMDYRQIGDFLNANKYLGEYNRYWNNYINGNKVNLIANNLEENNYIKGIFQVIDGSVYELYKVGFNASEISYNNALINKSMILKNWIGIRNEIKSDTLLSNCFNKIILKKEDLVKIYSLPINERPNNTKKLEDDLYNLQKNLLDNSKYFSKNGKESEINYKDVKKALPSKSIAIEIICFPYFRYQKLDNFYCALVLTPTTEKPTFIPLFFQTQLDSLLYKSEGAYEVPYINKLYNYNQNGKLLYDLIWKPIESIFSNYEKIYISPVGDLHKLNLVALPIEENLPIGFKFEIHTLKSTSKIIDYKEEFINKQTISNAYVYSGIDYDQIAEDTKLINNTNTIDLSAIQDERLRSSYGSKWLYLKYSEEEGNKVKSILSLNGINVNLYSGNKASEASFKKIELLNEKYILHLATHGYFFKDYEKVQPSTNDINSIYSASKDPLLRSGLIMAGGNLAWSGETHTVNQEDGVLTAYEISNLNLDNCQLALLSACETGLGMIKGNEGVYGLERSFYISGAKNLIVSLWKLSDKKTPEMVELFYNNLMTRKTIHKSLLDAQISMSKNNPNNPFSWAAFKLIE